MKSSTFAILLLFLVVAQQSSCRLLQPNDVVDDTCRTVPFPEFCVSTLRSDPKSASAQGPSQLGVILVDHIDSKVKSTLPEIATLISHYKGTTFAEGLLYCQQWYSTIEKASVPASRDALIKGNPKFAEQYMTDAAQKMNRCDEKSGGFESVLIMQDDFVRKAASNVAAIAKTME